MANMGKAMMGTGEATGEDRAIRAAEQAITNPLLDEAMKGARGLIVSITGGDDLLLMEVDEVASHIKELVDPDADIIWGSAFDPALAGRIRVSVVATGIDTEAAAPALAFAAAPSVAAAAVPIKVGTAPIFGPAPPALFAPVPAPIFFNPPEQAALPLEAPVPAEETAADELLLTVERMLVLEPPEGMSEVATIDPFAGEAPSAIVIPIRGPSLFERMATLARGTARQVRDAEDHPPLPHLYRGREWTDQRIARAA